MLVRVQSSSEARSKLRPLAVAQAGVVSRGQALAHGVSARTIERLVGEQQWRRLDPGVFLTFDDEPSFEARAWAGVLIGGDGARLASSTAAHLQGLTDDVPDTITVLVPHHVRLAARTGWEFPREREGVRDTASRGEPPCTTVEDTVLDLCASGQPEDSVAWLTTAVQRRLVAPAQLRRALLRRRRFRHRSVVAGLLAEVAEGAQSPIEVTYLRDVERAHDLPLGVRQLVSADGSAIRDVWYVDYGVAVELDGRVGHEGMGRFRDMNRDNEAALTSVLTLRYGHHDLHARPCDVALQVAEALVRRGWDGLPARCPRCRLVA